MRHIGSALAQHIRSCVMMLVSSLCWLPAVMQDLDFGYVRDPHGTSDQLDGTLFVKHDGMRDLASLTIEYQQLL